VDLGRLTIGTGLEGDLDAEVPGEHVCIGRCALGHPLFGLEEDGCVDHDLAEADLTVQSLAVIPRAHQPKADVFRDRGRHNGLVPET